MNIFTSFVHAPSLRLGIKPAVEIGRPLKLGAYSNPLRTRHTFRSEKMSTCSWGLGTPKILLKASTSLGGA